MGNVRRTWMVLALLALMVALVAGTSIWIVGAPPSNDELQSMTPRDSICAMTRTVTSASPVRGWTVTWMVLDSESGCWLAVPDAMAARFRARVGMWLGLDGYEYPDTYCSLIPAAP